MHAARQHEPTQTEMNYDDGDGKGTSTFEVLKGARG